jgi:transcriptional regulator with XRE-family HTH domain
MDTVKELKDLGARLRDWRIRAKQTQEDFAARIKASVPTLRRMEKGDPNTAIHYWVEAVAVLGRTQDIQDLLREQRSMFDEIPQPEKMRKRVRRATPVLFRDGAAAGPEKRRQPKQGRK